MNINKIVFFFYKFNMSYRLLFYVNGIVWKMLEMQTQTKVYEL